jgi:hypothetical protein
MSAHTRRGPATFGCVLRIDHAEMLPGIVVIMAVLMRYRIGWNVGLLHIFWQQRFCVQVCAHN